MSLIFLPLMNAKTHTPCFSLDLYSPLNRSGSRSWALLLNLFWRSDITQCSTSATQTHAFSTFCVEENRKGFQTVVPGWRQLLPSYQGKGFTGKLSYVAHRQLLFSGLVLKHTMEQRTGRCARICWGFLSVLWLSPWGLQSHIYSCKTLVGCWKGCGNLP